MKNWEIKTMEQAEQEAATRTEETGDLHIATVSGSPSYPDYGVCRVPKVGDEVSYAFNGDYTPDGTVAKVSKTLKVITTTSGDRYYRVKQTGSWKRNGTWSLIQGHHYERNPHF